MKATPMSPCHLYTYVEISVFENAQCELCENSHEPNYTDRVRYYTACSASTHLAYESFSIEEAFVDDR